jgi:hypothetical protein
LLIEKIDIDIDIIHHPRRRHGNVNGFTRAYEGVGDVSKDDDFLNVTIMFFSEPLERVKPHVFCMNFMMGSMKVILLDKSQHIRFCRDVITGPPSSRVPMIIAIVVMYVKFTHKNLL